MLEGLVQHDHPLTITGILRRMRTVSGRGRVLTLTQSGRTDATYEEVGRGSTGRRARSSRSASATATAWPP